MTKSETTEKFLGDMLPQMAVSALILSVWLFVASFAQAQMLAVSITGQTSNPFDRHIRVAEGVYVFDRSQFVEHTGSVLSPWNPNAVDGVIERKRLGAVSIASGVKMHLDLVTQPMGTNYELRETASGSLVHVFSYLGEPIAPLLFSGHGVVYSYARVSPLCWGAATRKYEYINKKFVETRQPLLLVNAETELLRDIRLTATPAESSPVVAMLREGSRVTVLTYQKPGQFLVRTPLGLTGWLFGEKSESSLSITQCN